MVEPAGDLRNTSPLVNTFSLLPSSSSAKATKCKCNRNCQAPSKSAKYQKQMQVQVQMQAPSAIAGHQMQVVPFFAAHPSCAQLDHNLMGCRNKLFFLKIPEWGVGPTWAWHDIREVSVFMKTGEFLLHISLPHVQVNIFLLLFSLLATKKGELLGILGMGEVTVASSSMVIVCRTNKFTFSKFSNRFMLTPVMNHCFVFVSKQKLGFFLLNFFRYFP